MICPVADQTDSARIRRHHQVTEMRQAKTRGAVGVTANDKRFRAPLWAFSRRRGTSACERCANAAVHTFGSALDFQRCT